MATKSVKVNIDINNNLKSVEDLKIELRTLEAEFETVSVGSKRFNELGAQIKSTRNQLKDIDAQFEGLDKEQRAAALVDTFQGLVGAVGAVSSAFIAFGGDAEAIEGAEKKLLGVIGVVNGLRDASNGLVSAGKLFGPTFTAVGESIKAGFTAGATGAQTFKAALISTGIGAFIVAIGLLVANFDKLFGSAEAAKLAIEGINETLERQLFLIEDTTRRRANDAKIQEATLKSQGATEEEISELRQRNYAKDRDAAINAVGKINAAQDSALAKFKGTEKEKQELIDKYAQLRNAAIVARNNAETSLELEKIRLIDEANRKAEEKRKKRAEDRKKFIIDEESDLIAALQALKESEAKNERDLAKVQLDNELANLERERKAKVDEATKLGLSITKVNQEFDAKNEVARTNYNNTITKLDQEAADKRQAAREQELTSIDSYYQRLLTGVEQVVDDIAVTQNIVSEKQFDEINKFITTALGQTTDLLNKQNEEIANAGDNADEILKQRAENRLRLTVKLLEDEQLKRKAVFEQQLADEGLTEEQRVEIQNKAAADFQLFQDKKKAAIEKTAREIVEIDNTTTQKQKDNTVALIQFTQQSFSDLFSVLRDLNAANAGASEEEQRKAFERDKNYATAEAVINTLLTVTRIFGNAAANPKSILFPGQPYIEAAIAAATGFATVAKIRNATFQGGGSSAGGGAGSTGSVTGGAGGGSNILNPFAGQGGGGTNILPPRLAPPSGGGTKADTTGQFDQSVGTVPVVRAYVLSGDVTDAQTADARLQEKRKL
jgi:hypothetical protein